MAARRASTMITWNRPVEDWGLLLGDTAAVSAMPIRAVTQVASGKLVAQGRIELPTP